MPASQAGAMMGDSKSRRLCAGLCDNSSIEKLALSLWSTSQMLRRGSPVLSSREEAPFLFLEMNTKQLHIITMKPKKPEANLTVRFPPAMLDALRQLAAKHQRSLNGEIVWLLRVALEQEAPPTNKRDA
jgi:hypothetical protein